MRSAFTALLRATECLTVVGEAGGESLLSLRSREDLRQFTSGELQCRDRAKLVMFAYESGLVVPRTVR